MLMLRTIAAILALPFMVIVVVPTLLWWLWPAEFFNTDKFSMTQVSFWLSLVLMIFGVSLFRSTVVLFFQIGEGTLAPWDPPKKLVVAGPYRYVRNPMITGVILILSSLSVAAHSWILACWIGLFFLLNLIYYPLLEEKQLSKRFGKDWDAYSRAVPRWIPRLKPWQPEASDSDKQD